jgi:hypothetical protein
MVSKAEDMFGIDEFPGLYLVQDVDKEGNSIERQIHEYKEDLDLVKIATFLSEYMISSKKDSKDKPKQSQDQRKKTQPFEWVTSANYTDGFDGRASVVFYGENLEDVEEKLFPVAETINGAINVIFFQVDEDGKKFLKENFKLSKFPAIHLFIQNMEFDTKNKLAL